MADPVTTPAQPTPFQCPDARNLSPTQRTEIMMEVSRLLTPQQIQAFQQAESNLQAVEATLPLDATGCHYHRNNGERIRWQNAIDRHTENQRPIDAAITTVLTRHGISTQSPPLILPSHEEPSGRIMEQHHRHDLERDAALRDPAYQAAVQTFHNNNGLSNQLRRSLASPPPAQQQNIQQGGPMQTPGGTAPQRQQGGPP